MALPPIPTRPIAHVRFDSSQNPIEHWLDEHLQEVAQISAQYAHAFNSQDWGYMAGMWHDLGKYNPEFQHYIGEKTGYDAENAHIESNHPKVKKVNHSAAGALYAVEQYGNGIGRILAYLIAGHHSGLPDWKKNEASGRSLEEILQDKQHLNKALQTPYPIPKEILQKIPIGSKSIGGIEHFSLWIRMLFSCLVDADFLDTEQFLQSDKAKLRAQYPTLAELKIRFDAHMATVTATAKPTSVNQIRATILQDCRNAAQKPTGLFSLTVPTGGGKTLSGMAFALNHALAHQKQRIIYAIPYTSIIEQTANIYRAIFSDGVIEHHSHLDVNDPEKENAKSRLAAENWDAPIIVTTNVQLFESLFASRTSRCRKLHRLANSIIVLDEAQLLPPEFLNPILSAMKALIEHYNVTIVLSTATQPALHAYQDNFDKPIVKGFDKEKITEIMPNCTALFKDLNRVSVEFPQDLVTERSWEEIAQEIKALDTVLVIVNTKPQAAALCRLLPSDTYYLSTNLCGEHRSQKLAEIHQKLKARQPIRVVSTQLIEAGVDMDFPVVYRALSGLDSLAQAAGRCNREGTLEHLGRLVVFVPVGNSKLKGALGLGAETTRSLHPRIAANPLDHNHFKTYFEHFYSKAENLDKYAIEKLFTQDAKQCKIQFRTAAERFRLIKDEGVPVLVSYGSGAALIKELKAVGPHRQLMRQLQRYTVTIREQDKVRLEEDGDIQPFTHLSGVYELKTASLYSERYGLLLKSEPLSTSELIR